MAAISSRQSPSPLSLAIPAGLVIAFSLAIAHQTGLIGNTADEALLAAPQTVTIPVHPFEYRADGEYYKNGYAVDAPMVAGAINAPIEIMKYQVAVEDYQLCVHDGACQATDLPQQPGRPVTGVSVTDALAYGQWLSERTGEVWTVPTDEQMAFAAGDKFPDDALGIDPDSRNPALRWLADYDRETRRKAASDPAAQPLGHFGENEYGLADFAGNVWEWTTTCHRRVELGADVSTSIPTCGVHVTVGQHRAPMSFFIRDPKGGGCAVGTPPDNLGFRLIRDTRWYAPILETLRKKGIDI